MSPDDPRLVREGRSLREWLPDLLGPDPATRRRAENTVSAIFWGAPVADATVYQYLPPDLHQHQREVGEAIGEILADRAFDGSAFVLEAFEVMRADRARVREKWDLEQRLHDHEKPLDRASKRTTRERIKMLANEEAVGRLPNSSGTYTLKRVIENAGPLLLQMGDFVRAVLRGDEFHDVIEQALSRLGPRAHMFAEDLLEFRNSHGRLRYPDLLADVGCDDPVVVKKLMGMACSHDDPLAYSAMWSLRAFGQRAAELVPSLPDELLASRYDSERSDAVLTTLARIAPDRREVLEGLIEVARPAPPDIRPVTGAPQYTYDATMVRRGTALEALQYLGPFAEEVVPVLIDAIETFEEYDPDWGYESGNYGRIVNSLSKLGPAAAAAIPVLIPRVRAEGEIDWRIIRFFGQLGPDAREALPILQQLATELEMTVTELAEIADNEALNPLGWAIKQIEGNASS